MALDPNIPLAAIGAQRPHRGPADWMQNAYSLKTMMDQDKLNQMKIREQEQLSQASQQGGSPDEIADRIMRINPQAGMQLKKAVADAQSADFDQKAKAFEFFQKRNDAWKQRLGTVLFAPPERQAELYQSVISESVREGLIPPDAIPPQFDPDWIKGKALETLQFDKQMSEHRAQLDAAHKASLRPHELTEAQAKATTAVQAAEGTTPITPYQQELLKKPAAEGAGSDYSRFLTNYRNAEAAKKGKTVETLTPAELVDIERRAKKEWGQADDRPANQALVRIQTVDAEGKPITTFVRPQENQQFAAGPTADMRNRQNARGMVGTGIDAVQTLSQRVITETASIAQRAKATGMSVEAALADHPEYKTYQAARFALAGNLAVAQQGSRPSDADILKGWLPMVPDVFSDTKASADMKWALMRQLAAVPAGPGVASGTVRMKAPNGQESDVPANQVEHYKSLGAVEVK